MANVLDMADQIAITALWKRGWSQRRIARETGIHRETVGRYIRLGVPRAQAELGQEPAPARSEIGLRSNSSVNSRRA
jgi:IS30 family transposase